MLIAPDVVIDVETALARLKADLRDEWFQDPLRYEEVLTKAAIEDHFGQNPRAVEGEKSEEFNLPKKGFVLRCSLNTSIYDRFLYQALVDKLAGHYDGILHGRVFSHRLPGSKRKYMFKNGVEAWKRFNQAVDDEMRHGTHTLLVTDIQNYFEFIDVDRLIGYLHQHAPDTFRDQDPHIDMLRAVLSRWSPMGSIGIPQNQDCSSLLANVYLHPIDNLLNSKGYMFYRYMDEYRVICTDDFHARRALKDIIVGLRSMGQNVNPGKTHFVHITDADYEEHVPPAKHRLEEIDALFKSKRLVEIRRALPKLSDLTSRLVAEGQTESRDYRFCINRLVLVARCRALEFDFADMIDPTIDLLTSQPWSSDTVVRLLSVVTLNNTQATRLADLLMDRSRNIYEWQSYLLWQLMTTLDIRHGSKSRRLREFAKAVLEDDWACPMKAGAILYLGACGAPRDKVHAIRGFSAMASSRTVARAVVVASQEIPNESLDRYVRPYLRPDMLRSLDLLRAPNGDHTYFRPPPDLPASELFDDLPQEESA